MSLDDNLKSNSGKPVGLYTQPTFRKLLHTRVVSHTMARLFGPRACGRIIGKLLLPYVHRDTINVLAVSRELLSKDISEIESRTDINFIPWRSGHLGRLMEAWTPKECQTQANFIPEEKYLDHECWDKGVLLLQELVKVLETKAKVPIAMTANVDYWQEEPLRRYCAKSEMKHLVLDRENHMVGAYADLMRSEHKKAQFFTFDGHAAVFSEKMKILLMETTSCDETQVTVTGAPRMDVWLDERSSVEKDTITLLSFKTCLIEGMFEDAINIFIQIAHKYPFLKFAVKCKEGRGDYQRMQKLFEEENAPSNIYPEQHVNMRDLFDRSLLIIGFNTLSLAEALLTDASIIVPSWNVTENDSNLIMMNPNDEELSKEINFPRSIEEFKVNIEDSINSKQEIDRELRMKLTNRYMMFTKNETASNRVAKVINKLVYEDK